MRFDGETYDPEEDRERLESALSRIYQAMQAGGWWTLRELANVGCCSEASASARLRDLRKQRFRALYPCGGVEAKRVGAGAWLYRLVLPAPAALQLELLGGKP